MTQEPSASNRQLLDELPSRSAFILPLECGDSETVFEIPLAREIVSRRDGRPVAEDVTRDAAERFLRAVDARYLELPFHHDYRSYEACRTLIDLRNRVGPAALETFLDFVETFGLDGIREFNAWIGEFEERISA